MDASSVAVFFLVAGLALAALEIVMTGFILLPFGLGALLAAAAGFFGVPPVGQGLVFLAGSAGFYAALRPLARRLNEGDEDEGVGARRLVGATGVVLETIPLHDSGMVRIDREQWRAESADEAPLAPGTSVTVTEVRGTRLIVVPASVTRGNELPPDRPPTLPPA